MSTSNGKPLWELKGLCKQFPGVKAIDGVDLRIYPGEVHGLVGENGSGKSTLVKCLSGVYLPTSGRIFHKGRAVTLHDPTAARSLGVATIFQELSLIPNMSVGENIFTGRLPKLLRFWVDWNSIERMGAELLEKLGIQLDPNILVGELSVAEQQMVEIAKALSLNASLLIMDEPTAALGLEEVNRLHQLVRNLAARGCAVIYISHRLDEVVDLVDRVTVMKDGKIVGSDHIGNLSLDAIVSMMIGGDFRSHYPKERNLREELLLSVEGLRTAYGVRGATFQLHRGEVFGLAGLIGTGRTSIARALFGIDRVTSGSIRLHVAEGERAVVGSPRKAIGRGIALLTEDRKGTGLFMNFNGIHNISIAKLDQISRLGVMGLKREERLGREHFERLRISSAADRRSVQFLSGGNQQKVIIARWVFSKAEIFILDEPTQGIDVAAKVEVYGLINNLTREGKGVVLISSDFEELLAISDTIGIVKDGTIIETRDAREIDKKYLVEKVFLHQIRQRSFAKE